MLRTFFLRTHSCPGSQQQSSRNPAGATPSAPWLVARLCATSTTRLRFQKGGNVREFVSNRCSVNSPERAADVQPPFVLQHLHTAPADGGVYMFIDPRPWDRGHLRQIHDPGSAAHI